MCQGAQSRAVMLVDALMHVKFTVDCNMNIPQLSTRWCHNCVDVCGLCVNKSLHVTGLDLGFNEWLCNLTHTYAEVSLCSAGLTIRKGCTGFWQASVSFWQASVYCQKDHSLQTYVFQQWNFIIPCKETRKILLVSQWMNFCEVIRNSFSSIIGI